MPDAFRQSISVVGQINRLLAVLLLMVVTCTSCAVEKATVYYIDGKPYGVTPGLFRSRWWNYYERGCSYAEGEFWKEAEADFKKAIKQRDQDLRRARTYGVLNFIDYFPHRELGVCYLHQDRYPEAVQELERSASDTPSAKAYYFLDKARRERLLQDQADTETPSLVIHAPRSHEVTNAFQLEVCGTAQDDHFVARVLVGGQEVPMEVSQQAVSFCEDTVLEPGDNELVVVAEDLMGQQVQMVVPVYVDREGPQLSLEGMDHEISPSYGRIITLKGFVDDASSIQRVSINETEIAIPQDQETSFPFSQRLVLSQGKDTISYLVEDAAGNRNQGIIRLELPALARQTIPRGHSLAGLTQIAFLSDPKNTMSDANASQMMLPIPSARALFDRTSPEDELLLAANVIPWRFPDGTRGSADAYANEPPRIRFKDLEETQTSYFDTIYLEGNVQGSDPVKGLTLNGESILRRQGRNLFFGIFRKLEPGQNEMVFTAEDARGRIREERIYVEYIVPRVWKLQSRLKVFVIPFQPVRCESTLGEYVSQHFQFTLVDQKRFNVVNREELDRIILEQVLNRTELVDPETAVKMGRIANAEEALVGSVYEGRKSIEIFAQMIDTETGEILMEKDVFHEDKSPDRLREITAGLATKFKNAMPLIQGNIQQLKGNKLYTDLGKEERIRKGMRVLVFRQAAEIVHPATGKVLGCETEELGEAIINKVEGNRSEGKFRNPEARKSVTLDDRVITK